MKAAIYLRYSSDMQRDSLTIESQRRMCRNFCESRGYEIVGEYVDEAHSASTTKRPAFQQMIEAAHAREFGVIVCSKLDRFSRSITDVLLTLRELEQHGVAFASASEQFDFTTPIGKVLLTMLAAFAEWYLDNLSAETTRGKRERAEQGLTNASVAPVGYDLVDGQLQPNTHADAVREAFGRYATGDHADKDIAAFLSGELGRFVSADSAAAILRNPVYCGLVAYRGMISRTGGRKAKRLTRLIDGAHEAIILREVWDQVQAVRRDRTRHGGAEPKRVYLVGKIARCAHCGEPLRAKALSDREYQLTYRCTARERGKTCDGSQAPVREAHLLPQIEELVNRLALPREMREAALAELRHDSDIEAIEQQRRVALAERDRLALLFRKGHISEAQLDQDMARIADELARLQPRASRVTDEAALMLDKLSGVWERADKAERAQMLRLMLDSVLVDTTKKRIAAFVPHADFAAMFEALAMLRDLANGSDGHRLIRRGLFRGLRVYFVVDV